jgi:hypothetical protein
VITITISILQLTGSKVDGVNRKIEISVTNLTESLNLIHPLSDASMLWAGQAVHTALTLYLYFIATALPPASYNATAASPPPPAAAARRLDAAAASHSTTAPRLSPAAIVIRLCRSTLVDCCFLSLSSAPL